MLIDGKGLAVAALATGPRRHRYRLLHQRQAALSQMPELQVAPVPSEIATGPEYYLAILNGRRSAHARFGALYALSRRPTGLFRLRFRSRGAAHAGAVSAPSHLIELMSDASDAAQSLVGNPAGAIISLDLEGAYGTAPPPDLA